MLWPSHSTTAQRTPAIQCQVSLPKLLWAGGIYFAVWLKICTSTKALGSVTPYECDFIEKGPILPTRPNGGSKFGSTTPLAPNSVEHDFKFVSPTIIVNRLPPTQLRVHNDTRTGTACSTSCSTLSNTTSCGTSTCAKRSRRSGCQMLHTVRLSCELVKSAKESKSNRLSRRVVFQSLLRWTFRVAPFRTYFVRSTRILLATTTMDVIATSIPKHHA